MSGLHLCKTTACGEGKGWIAGWGRTILACQHWPLDDDNDGADNDEAKTATSEHGRPRCLAAPLKHFTQV